MSDDATVIIVGAGMVGLWLAQLLAEQRISVALVESREPNVDWCENDIAVRVSAINAEMIKLLQQRGLLSIQKTKGVSLLRAMQVWDDASDVSMVFDSAKIAQPYLGYVVENRELVRQLWLKLSNHPDVTIHCPRQPVEIKQNRDGVVCQLDQGAIHGRLLVGCDGAQSWVRQQTPLKVAIRSYQQQALVTVVKTEYPHQSFAYQRFLKTGPVGLLPLHNPYHSALIWSCENNFSRKLMQLSSSQVANRLMNVMQSHLGSMEVMVPIRAIPLVARHAEDAVYGRVVLQGDALQNIHPLAGQGVNLGLKDACCLSQVIDQHRRHFDENKMTGLLAFYARRRQVERKRFGLLMRALSEGYASQDFMDVMLRSKGMETINRFDCIKNQIMQSMIG